MDVAELGPQKISKLSIGDKKVVPPAVTSILNDLIYATYSSPASTQAFHRLVVVSKVGESTKFGCGSLPVFKTA